MKQHVFSDAAEQAVIGAILISQDTWEEIEGLVGEADFYRHDHRLVFAACLDLINQGIPPDVITLSDKLDPNGSHKLLAYLGMLAQNVPSPAVAVHYARIVRNYSVRRQGIAAGYWLAETLEDPETDLNAALDAAQTKVMGLGESTTPVEPEPIGIHTLAFITELERRYEQGGELSGLATGFNDLDALTSGLQPGTLNIIAGRPGMGKTTLAMNILEYIAITEQKPVLMFSLEMPASELMERLTASLGRIDMQVLRTGKLASEDWPKVSKAASALRQAPLLVDDSASLSIAELKARARRAHKRSKGLAAIAVDYIQLLGSDGKKENRNLEVSEISRGLKALAKDLNTPVICLSQLNRQVESRVMRRPMMSDLRDSGAVEQDADIVAFVYRDEVYHADSPDAGTAEIIIGKHRSGPTGTVRLAFLGQFNRFENLAPGWTPPPPGQEHVSAQRGKKQPRYVYRPQG